MANDTLTFSCPACGIKLTIPSTMAGVAGPCPSCRVQIQAPYPSPPVQQAPVQQAPVQQAPVQQTPVQQTPVQQTPVQQTPVQQAPVQGYGAYTPPPESYHPPHQHTPPAGYAGYSEPPILPTADAVPPVNIAPSSPPAYQYPGSATIPQGSPYPPLSTEPHAGQPAGSGYPPAQIQPSSPQVNPVAPVPTDYPGQVVNPAFPQQGYPAYPDADSTAHHAAPTLVVMDPQAVEPSGQTPPVLRPEPRQLPTRTSPSEVVAKQMPDPDPNAPRSRRASSTPRHSRQKSPAARFIIGVLFIIAALLVIVGVKKVIDGPADTSEVKPLKPIMDHSGTGPDNAPPASKSDVTPVIPVSPPEQPDVMEPVPDAPEGIDPISPSAAATETLIKFLEAKTLEERMPLMETKTPEAELAASCLAAALPSTPVPSIDAIKKTSTSEQATDFYHRVVFENPSGQQIPYAILVRTRGSSPPKVVADPFLDSYGGRLAAYAKVPSEKAGIFQVIVSPLASCYDERVPNREKKLTLKLLPHDEAKEIVSAYFGRQSKIGLMLEDGTYSLSYGKAQDCTVMLRWNTEDDPERPYLEALDIKAWDWNP